MGSKQYELYVELQRIKSKEEGKRAEHRYVREFLATKPIRHEFTVTATEKDGRVQCGNETAIIDVVVLPSGLAKEPKFCRYTVHNVRSRLQAMNYIEAIHCGYVCFTYTESEK